MFICLADWLCCYSLQWIMMDTGKAIWVWHLVIFHSIAHFGVLLLSRFTHLVWTGENSRIIFLRESSSYSWHVFRSLNSCISRTQGKKMSRSLCLGAVKCVWLCSVLHTSCALGIWWFSISMTQEKGGSFSSLWSSNSILI